MLGYHSCSLRIEKIYSKTLNNLQFHNLVVMFYFSGIFAINDTTGVMTIAKKLDRETVHAHTLIVTAKDHGIPSLSSNVSINVLVSDTNDKNPVLIIDSTMFEILEVNLN